jgi:type II secretory pathway pseudopilin PulG
MTPAQEKVGALPAQRLTAPPGSFQYRGTGATCAEAQWVGGFTLIEIVVTLFILATVVATTIPAFLSDRERSDLDFATERIEALLYLARDSALHSASPVALVLDSVSGLVWLTTSESGGGSEALLTDSGASLDLPMGIRLETTSARARFLFQPSGAAFPDTLTLRGSTESRSVTVNPWTGHAVVLR